jgi:tetratricopeptide (TPR) repeat protein
MFVRLVCVLSLLGVLAGASTAAWAGRPSGKKAAATARAHYKKGMKAYDLGRFDEAVSEFEAAYDIDDNTAYLFNIAQAYRRGNNDSKALEFYKTYLRKAPDAADRANVESILANIEKKLTPTAPPPAASTAPAPVPVARPSAGPAPAFSGQVVSQAPPPAAEHPGRGLRIAGITTAAVGLAACGAGVAFAFRAKSKDDDAANSPVYNPQLKKDADSARTYTYVFFGVGGAAVATGVVLAIFGWTTPAPSSGAPSVTSVQPIIGPSMTGLAFAGAF